MITEINHIGLCVKSIDETLKIWKQAMGAEEIGRASYPQMGQTSAMIKVGEAYFELMEPCGEGGLVANFLEKHGEGIHHISVHTDDLPGDKVRFEEAGVRILGNDEDPIVFTHPKSFTGTIFEISSGGNEKVEL